MTARTPGAPPPDPSPGPSAGPAPVPAGERRIIGRIGEELACRFLEERGLAVLARNWRCREGELDAVVRDGSHAVAVEVKTRTGEGYGHPLEAITHEKSQRLRRLIVSWARQHTPPGTPLRVDAIAVRLWPQRGADIEHLRGIS